MHAKQGILILFTGLCLPLTTVTANDAADKKAVNVSDLTQLSEVASPAANNTLPGASEFAGELRISPSPETGKVAVNKSDLSKTMIGKFRINGI